MDQKTSTMIAILLTPILGPLIWRVLLAPGRAVYRVLWRRLPDGKWRDKLLKPVSGR